MSLTLHSHPFASFCQKVLVALYENATPFEARLVDYANDESRRAFFALWPLGKMPVLRDEAHGVTIPETSIIIEYLDHHYPGPAPLVPDDPDRARAVRLADRLFDQYVQAPMQKIVGDHLRGPGQSDPVGVDEARQALRSAYALFEREMAVKTWAAGEALSMADCGAGPALHYAELVEPFGSKHPHLAAYLARLKARPAFAQVLAEAKPYIHLFPVKTQPARE